VTTRTKKQVAAAVALVLLAGAAVVVWKIGPRNLIGMALYDQRQEGRLRVGDLAPDVELFAGDGARRERLSRQLGDRPLVLIFGSFT
jgi:hypothetical protein